MTERQEAFMRILVGMVSGFILGLWKAVIQIVTVVNWFYVMFKKRRNKGMAKFCNLWVTYVYNYTRYMTFSTNVRPFPFNDFGKDVEKVDMKRKG